MSGPEVPTDVLSARERAEEIVCGQRVQFAIDQTAVRIGARLASENPLLLCVLQGGLNYTAELARRLLFPLQLGYVHVGRYGDRTSGRDLRWIARPSVEVAGRTVVLVDDVLDQGVTLGELVRWANEAGARRVITTVLVEKEIARPGRLAVDFAVLHCPDRYLFGCGMDYRGYWRNLPSIYALPEDLEDAG